MLNLVSDRAAREDLKECLLAYYFLVFLVRREQPRDRIWGVDFILIFCLPALIHDVNGPFSGFQRV